MIYKKKHKGNNKLKCITIEDVMENLDKHINIIHKYFAGEANDDEIQLLFNWINLDSANKNKFDEFKKAWDLSKTDFDLEVSSINVDDEWIKINNEINSNKEAKTIHLKINKKRQLMQFTAAIAAVFIIGIGIFSLFNSQNKKLVAENKIIESSLSDGSIISLNTNSELEYSKNFNKKTRTVKLKGEAFFKIKANSEKPFVINTGSLKIEVVGTSFNVNAKKQNGNVEITVKSGIVSVYTKNNKSDSVLLYAGEHAVFNKTNNNIQKKINKNINYLSWKTKKLIFEGVELQKIVNTLNKTYNVNIIILNPDLKKCKLTNTFDKQSLKSIIKVLEATLDIQIDKKGNVYEIRGSGCVE